MNKSTSLFSNLVNRVKIQSKELLHEVSEELFLTELRSDLLLSAFVAFFMLWMTGSIKTPLESQSKVNASSFEEDITVDKNKAIISVMPSLVDQCIYNFENGSLVKKTNTTLKELMEMKKEFNEIKTILVLSDRTSPAGCVDDVMEMAETMNKRTIKVGKAKIIR